MKKLLRFWLLVLLVLAFSIACSDSTDEGISDGDITDGDATDGDTTDGDTTDGDTTDGDVTRDEIMGEPVDNTYLVDVLENDVAVAYDDFGIPHIYAKTAHDAGVAMGYLQAENRIVQMDFFRKVGRGRMTELLVTAIDDLINYDLINRAYFSQADGSELHQAMYDSLSDASKDMLQAFAEGVNARLARYREDPSDWPAPFEFPIVMQDPDQIADWDPLDTIAIARLQTWDLSGGYGSDIDRSLLYELLDEETYNEIVFAEPGAFVSISPHEGSLKSASTSTTNRQPRRDPAVIARLKAMKKDIEYAQKWIPHHQAGASNNWVISPNDGVSYLCNDPHLSLYSPSIFMPMSVDVREMSEDDTELHTGGVAFPGTPAVVIGRNADVAWGETVVGYDVKDIYQEQVTYDANGIPLSVLFEGNQVDVIPVVQELKEGHGDNPKTIERTLYYVPHHGPIIPSSMDPDAGLAYTLKWTGQEPTGEIEAFLDLAYAKNVEEAFTAVEKFEVGAQNFVFADTEGNIGWYPHAKVPIRSGDHEAYPPWRVLPGTGEQEWSGNYVPNADLPQLYNPEAGFVITANNDPTGATLDNDVLNDGTYWMFDPSIGYRAYTAKSGIIAAMEDGSWNWEDMSGIQTSYYSDYSEQMTTMILALVDRFALADQLSANAETALGLLRDWDFYELSGLADYTDPSGSAAVSDATVRQSAAATTYFYHLMIRIGRELMIDELEAAGSPGVPGDHHRKATIRTLRHLYENPGEPESLLWDDVSTPDVETAADILLRAIELAVEDLLGREEFANDTLETAYWGKIHNLTLAHPMGILTSMYNQGPYALGGGPFTVNVANFGIGLDTESETFDFGSGPSLRIINEVSADGITTHFTVPGGVNERSDSDHFLDLFDLWANKEYTDMVIGWEDVKTKGISHLTALVPAP